MVLLYIVRSIFYIGYEKHNKNTKKRSVLKNKRLNLLNWQKNSREKIF